MVRAQSVPGVLSSDAIKHIIGNQDAQLALLNYAAEVVFNMFSQETSFPALTAAMGRLPNVVDMWDAAVQFHTHMPGALAQMPDDLLGFVVYTRYHRYHPSPQAWANNAREHKARAKQSLHADAEGT